MKELANPNNMFELKESKKLLEDFFGFIEAIEDVGAMAATYSAVNDLVEDRIRRRQPWALVCPMD